MTVWTEISVFQVSTLRILRTTTLAFGGSFNQLTYISILDGCIVRTSRNTLSGLVASSPLYDTLFISHVTRTANFRNHLFRSSCVSLSLSLVGFQLPSTISRASEGITSRTEADRSTQPAKTLVVDDKRPPGLSGVLDRRGRDIASRVDQLSNHRTYLGPLKHPPPRQALSHL
ncbi:hypothetical protein CH063_07864 [Colletotrichum higginsianum]|uniref:Uncharacterized protein n=1 Tax=Colletotrichum higginsianum (strain IMI 349063) TaxID=759273 RepID=H1V7P9_COLHI|nr:hypothetical protein CH063_07864 [Colletotrichum higginsianum]